MFLYCRNLNPLLSVISTIGQHVKLATYQLQAMTSLRALSFIWGNRKHSVDGSFWWNDIKRFASCRSSKSSSSSMVFWFHAKNWTWSSSLQKRTVSFVNMSRFSGVNYVLSNWYLEEQKITKRNEKQNLDFVICCVKHKTANLIRPITFPTRNSVIITFNSLSVEHFNWIEIVTKITIC